MNDQELDEMLDQWEVPLMRDSMREELRIGFASISRPQVRAKKTSRMVDAILRIRIGRIAFAGIAAAALLFGIIQLAPKTARLASPGFRIPFYVEFEFARYPEDGSVPHQSLITSFPYAGHEIVMSVTESRHSLLNRFRGIASSIRNQIILVAPSLVLPKEPPMAEPDWFAGFVNSGCSKDKNVVGHEIVAGHATTIVQSESPTNRIKVWMAPDLGCYALKLTDEVREPNGTYTIKLRKEAVEVTMNP
jgi:hypothetical protein